MKTKNNISVEVQEELELSERSDGIYEILLNQKPIHKKADNLNFIIKPNNKLKRNLYVLEILFDDLTCEHQDVSQLVKIPFSGTDLSKGMTQLLNALLTCNLKTFVDFPKSTEDVIKLLNKNNFDPAQHKGWSKYGDLASFSNLLSNYNSFDMHISIYSIELKYYNSLGIKKDVKFYKE